MSAPVAAFASLSCWHARQMGREDATRWAGLLDDVRGGHRSPGKIDLIHSPLQEVSRPFNPMLPSGGISAGGAES